MELIRKISTEEKRLLEFLIQKAKLNLPTDWDHNLFVKPLNDGGMGSLLLLPHGMSTDNNRLFGKQASECEFFDVDGVKIIASLNLDDKGRLFELDIWKTDYTALVNIPKVLK